MLIVFAKAPRPGRVKTRLIAALGAAGAARLQTQLLEHTLVTARAARSGRVELHCAPHRGHPDFRCMARRFGVRLRAQEGEDLGARMLHAFERALAVADAAVLVGSDCPELRPGDFRAAFAALHAGGDAVFAPAEDGGYALIGLRRVSPLLFEGVTWGGPSVLTQTRDRLALLGWSWRELRTVRDVDRPADLGAMRRNLRRRQISSAVPRASRR